jgi:hypothetical protein
MEISAIGIIDIQQDLKKKMVVFEEIKVKEVALKKYIRTYAY